MTQQSAIALGIRKCRTGRRIRKRSNGEGVDHSDIEVTMPIYAHASLDDKRTALRKLGDALG